MNNRIVLFLVQFRVDGAQLKKTLLILILAYLSFAPAIVGQPAEQVKEASKQPYGTDAFNHFKTAASFQIHGSLDKALSEYELCLKSDNRIVEAWINVGLIYKSHDPCVACLERSVKRKPKQATALVCLGAAYLEQGEYEKAVQQFDNCIRVQPNFVGAYFLMAYTLHLMGDFKESEVMKNKGEEKFEARKDKGSEHLVLPKLAECDKLFPQKNFPGYYENGACSIHLLRDPGTDFYRFEPGVGLRKVHLP